MKWTSAKNLCIDGCDGNLHVEFGVMGQERAERPWVVYRWRRGAGTGQAHRAGHRDEEYRSEESMPQLAKILAAHHGFRCTVLFAIDKDSTEIDPEQRWTIFPDCETSPRADLMVIFTRFRDLPDDQMKPVISYSILAGRLSDCGRRRSLPTMPSASTPPTQSTSWQSKEEGSGRIRPAGARRDLDRSLRPPPAREHPRAHRQGHAGSPRSLKGVGQDLGTKRCVRHHRAER